MQSVQKFAVGQKLTAREDATVESEIRVDKIDTESHPYMYMSNAVNVLTRFIFGSFDDGN